VLALLRATLLDARDPDTDRVVLEAALTSAESIVTFRRRYRGRSGVSAVLELMVVDTYNPRSLTYQLHRMQTDLRSIPNTSPNARPLRLLDSVLEKVRLADPAALSEEVDGHRDALADFTAGLQASLRDLSVAIRDLYHQPPPTQQALLAQQVVDREPSAAGRPG
jgi:uncharacterized alpha-E superfamily protein